MSVELDSTDIKAMISERYGARARAVLENGTQSCCGSQASCCGSVPAGVNAFSEGLYAVDELDGVPLQAALATLGCANPLALSELHPGEIVLDVGSGGGLDVILSARRVGSEGHAYGLDMTDEMLQLAWRNALDAKVGNVTFMKGDVEAMPIPDNSIDVVISNCVINLSTNKDRALAEIYRVLKPGGRLAVADVVVRGGLPEDSPITDLMRRDPVAWGNCVAGALSDSEYEIKLFAAGFVDRELQVLRTHETAELFGAGLPAWSREFSRDQLDAVMCRFTSSLVRARKPACLSDRNDRHG
jgi:arsenite methyltransferase